MGSDAGRDLVGPLDGPSRWVYTKKDSSVRPDAAKTETEDPLHLDGDGLWDNDWCQSTCVALNTINVYCTDCEES